MSPRLPSGGGQIRLQCANTRNSGACSPSHNAAINLSAHDATILAESDWCREFSEFEFIAQCLCQDLAVARPVMGLNHNYPHNMCGVGGSCVVPGRETRAVELHWQSCAVPRTRADFQVSNARVPQESPRALDLCLHRRKGDASYTCTGFCRNSSFLKCPRSNKRAVCGLGSRSFPQVSGRSFTI